MFLQVTQMQSPENLFLFKDPKVLKMDYIIYYVTIRSRYISIVLRAIPQALSWEWKIGTTVHKIWIIHFLEPLSRFSTRRNFPPLKPLFCFPQKLLKALSPNRETYLTSLSPDYPIGGSQSKFSGYLSPCLKEQSILIGWRNFQRQRFLRNICYENYRRYAARGIFRLSGKPALGCP